MYYIPLFTHKIGSSISINSTNIRCWLFCLLVYVNQQPLVNDLCGLSIPWLVVLVQIIYVVLAQFTYTYLRKYYVRFFQTWGFLLTTWQCLWWKLCMIGRCPNYCITLIMILKGEGGCVKRHKEMDMNSY